LRVGGLVIGAGSLFLRGVTKLAALTVRNAVPAISPNRDFCLAGGLMSYASDNVTTAIESLIIHAQD
jgi:hypothetical protein